MNEVVKLMTLSKEINNRKILNNIDLSIKERDFCGIIGRNGSGKSMLLKVISGLVEPSDGKAIVFGETVGYNGKPAKDTGLLIENPGLLNRFSAFSQILMLAEISGINKPRDETIRVLKELGLNPFDNRVVKKYSLGMKQKIGIAIAILGKPSLILLDEPTSNLDKKSIVELHKLLEKLNKNGATILLASHQKEDIESMCNRIIKMENGRILFDRTISRR